MLLRNSISNTKKFFQKTVDSFKSFLSKGSGTYEKLPKTPPFHPFSCGRNHNGTNKGIKTGYNDLDNFYTEFTNQWDSQNSKVKKTMHKSTKQSQELCTSPPQNKNSNYAAKREEFEENNEERGQVVKSKRSKSNASKVMKKSDLCSRSVREKRLYSVAQKLKELEFIMDKGNVDHKLDVEEVLHYYSRLTCPAYLDIVDKFFMEMCAEFFSPQAGSFLQFNSTTKLL